MFLHTVLAPKWGRASDSFFLPDCGHGLIFLSPLSLIVVIRVEILFEKMLRPCIVLVCGYVRLVVLQVKGIVLVI